MQTAQSAVCKAQHHIQLSRKLAYWWVDLFFVNEIFPPRVMLKQTLDLCPGLDQPFPRPVYILTSPVVLPCRPGQLRSDLPESGQIHYSIFFSVLITPISVPQCPHFKMKSGYRPFVGVINCALVPDTATIIRHPHCGQQRGRISLLSFVGFFPFSISLYSPLSIAALCLCNMLFYAGKAPDI